MLSSRQAESDDRSDAGRPKGEASSQPRTWLGRLSTFIASFAGGMAIGDVGGTLGYHGLAGAVALSGVLTAAVWVRGLDRSMRLALYAPSLLLVPAGCAALVAAFSTGPTVSILTALAAVLTVSAVLVTRELEYAALLLIGAAFIAFGAVEIAFGAAIVIHYGVHGVLDEATSIIHHGVHGVLNGEASIIHHGVLGGVPYIGGGIGDIAVGAVSIYGSREEAVMLSIVLGIWITLLGLAAVLGGEVLFGVTLIVSGAGLIASRSALIAGGTGTIALMAGAIARRSVLIGVTLIVSGAALIPYGAWAIANRSLLPGAAALIALGAGIIAYGAATIGLPSIILNCARLVVEWATTPPRAVEDQRKESLRRQELGMSCRQRDPEVRTACDQMPSAWL